MRQMTGDRHRIGSWRATAAPAVAAALALTLLALSSSAPPASAVTVSIVPADTTVTLGDTFFIRVEADAFADLKGYQLVYGYNPAVITLTGAQPGEVLTAGGGGYFNALLPDVTAPPDTAWYDAARLDGSTASPGVLVYFSFDALAEGESLIQCGYADFRDSQNAQTLPGCVGGRVVVVGPVSARPASWGRMKALYR